MNESEKKGLKAVQDAIKEHLREHGEPQDGQDLKKLFRAAQAAAAGKKSVSQAGQVTSRSQPIDRELEKQRELAKILEKWRKP